VALVGQTPLGQPLAVLILFSVHLQQLEAAVAVTSLLPAHQEETALREDLEAAGRLIRLLAQVLAVEAQVLRDREIQEEHRQGLHLSLAAAVEAQQQSGQTRLVLLEALEARGQTHIPPGQQQPLQEL
jgi:hypothetical protein